MLIDIQYLIQHLQMVDMKFLNQEAQWAESSHKVNKTHQLSEHFDHLYLEQESKRDPKQ